MDIQHHYIEKGNGEPVILLHGNGEESSYFVHQINELSQQFRVIAVDSRGHGKTPRGNAPLTIDGMAKDLCGFMDRSGITEANILGFSDGANIAMRFAINHPHRVKRLILNGGNLVPSGIKNHVQFPIEIGYRVAKLFANKSDNAKKNAELLSLMVESPNIPVADLQNIKCPTLVIAGTKDMVKTRHTKLIAASLPDSTLCIIKGDHFIAKKRPEAFNKAVMNFLTR